MKLKFKVDAIERKLGNARVVHKEGGIKETWTSEYHTVILRPIAFPGGPVIRGEIIIDYLDPDDSKNLVLGRVYDFHLPTNE